MLDTFKINEAKDVLELINRQTVAVSNQLTAGKQDDYGELKKQHAELVKKIERLENGTSRRK